MAVLLYVLIILTLGTLVYRGAVLPTIKRGLRYRLYGYRDKLRRIAYENPEELGSKDFHYLQDSINVLTKINANIAYLFFIRQLLKQEPKLRQRIQKRHKVIVESPIEDIRSINEDCGNIFIYMIFYNSFGCFAIVTPIICFVKLAQKFNLFLQNRLYIAINALICKTKEVIYLPENTALRYNYIG